MRQSHQLVEDRVLKGFAKGVIAEGRFLFVSGVAGRGTSMGAQAEYCWNTIKERVESMGGRLENIVQRMTFVTDIAQWQGEGNPRQRAWLTEHCPAMLESPPSGTLIGCVALADPNYMVEIQIVVVLD
jgi:enamine deaminase RidA (YjgF/YER057c/UK114 family)